MTCMTPRNNYVHKNLAYWNDRAKSYSVVNQTELTSSSHNRWQTLLQETIASQFSDRRPEELRILESGTGPGFFAILLAELNYDVTAIDLSSRMLSEAKQNAGALAEAITFLRMNAQDLDFEDSRFDVIVSRNLTWNLPDPLTAYEEWVRVLKPGGLLLNFDANWYRYLFDEDALARYEEDRRNTASHGIPDENIGESFPLMEEMARFLPLSDTLRPEWDRIQLEQLGMNVKTDESVWQRVWSKNEIINFHSTPMFMIQAIKNS